jgi:hypothetical protein
MMEAASISKTSINFYQTSRRNNPEDSHRHIHRRENLTSHLVLSELETSLDQSGTEQLWETALFLL